MQHPKQCKMCINTIPNYRIYCSNLCKFSDIKYNKSRISNNKNDTSLEVKCKYCDYTSSDETNKSGSLTRHLKNKHGIILDDIETHFNIENKKHRDVLTCKFCDWTTYDLTNKSGSYTVHLKNRHSVNFNNYLTEFPEHSELFSDKIRLKHFINENTDNSIICEICNQKMRKISNSHLKQHNITPTEYKQKYHIRTTNSITTTGKQSDAMVQLQSTGIVPKRVSNEELDIRTFISDLGIKYETNVRKYTVGKELDIFISDLNIAIEYNGLYWHREANIHNKWYHLEKTLEAEKNNIHLIQIFSDEWNNKREIVKSRLKNILKLNSRKIHARKCIIKEIDARIKNEFLNKYHIQGADISKIKLGAFYNNELISIMTFGKPRLIMGHKNVKNKTYELIRFCIKENITISGISNKIFEYFLKNYKPKSIISYADRRWSTINKNVYESMNFKLINDGKPNYWYVCKPYNIRYNRYQFAKHKLVESGNDITKTEWEIMQELGYDRIWDCGSLKYEFKN